MAYCDKCNRVVIFAMTVDGKQITLDPKAPVYRMAGLDYQAERLPSAMAAHAWTCPKVKDFSEYQKSEGYQP